MRLWVCFGLMIMLGLVVFSGCSSVPDSTDESGLDNTTKVAEVASEDATTKEDPVSGDGTTQDPDVEVSTDFNKMDSTESVEEPVEEDTGVVDVLETE